MTYRKSAIHFFLRLNTCYTTCADNPSGWGGPANLLLSDCHLQQASLPLGLDAMVTVCRPQSTYCMQESRHSLLGNLTGTVLLWHSTFWCVCWQCDALCSVCCWCRCAAGSPQLTLVDSMPWWSFQVLGWQLLTEEAGLTNLKVETAALSSLEGNGGWPGSLEGKMGHYPKGTTQPGSLGLHGGTACV